MKDKKGQGIMSSWMARIAIIVILIIVGVLILMVMRDKFFGILKGSRGVFRG